jgi:ParB family chromosome partitioning protein
MFLLKAQKYLQEMEGDKMARKPALGRGLDALIPGGDFSYEKEAEPVEVDINLSSDIDVGTDIAPVEPESDPPADEALSLETPLEISEEQSEPEQSQEGDDISDEAALSALTSIEYVPVEPEDLVESEDLAELEAPVEPEVFVEPEPQPSLEGEGSPLEVPVEPEVTVESEVPVEPEIPAEPEVSVSGGGGDLPLSRDVVVQITVDKLVPNPSQPRKNFDETELQELADSIKEHGVIMPIIAADTGDGNYTIIAGERRTRAARLAGLEDVPVIIRDYTDLKRMEVSLIENIQRSDLNPIEEATAYKNLMDFSSLSQGDLAARVGKNRSTVTNALRLLKLSAEVQKSLETGDISSGHARALLSVTNKTQREKLFKEITAKGLSVRETEKKASALNSPGEEGGGASGGAAEKASKRPPEIAEMEEKFIEKLGTKVSIDGSLEKGRIHIEYYSMEDLDRLYEIIGG